MLAHSDIVSCLLGKPRETGALYYYRIWSYSPQKSNKTYETLRGPACKRTKEPLLASRDSALTLWSSPRAVLDSASGCGAKLSPQPRFREGSLVPSRLHLHRNDQRI